MRRFNVIVIAALMIPAAAHAQVSQFELVKPGDNVMSCQALATEINALSNGQAQAAKKAQNGRRLLGFAGQALSMAAPLMGGQMDGASGLIAQHAVGAIQTQAMQQQIGEATAAGVSGQVQRMARLSEIYAAKGC